MGEKHRATGNPRGRPVKIPFDFGSRIMKALERRVDPQTGLAKPDWRGLARELGVSRSTIARQVADLRNCGEIESVYLPVHPGSQAKCAYYRLKGERK